MVDIPTGAVVTHDVAQITIDLEREWLGHHRSGAPEPVPEDGDGWRGDGVAGVPRGDGGHRNAQRGHVRRTRRHDHAAVAVAGGDTGGVLAGRAVTMWVVVRRLHGQDPARVGSILGPGLLVWFVVDSVGSVVSGGWLNVVGNVGFLVMLGVSLLASWQVSAHASL